MNATIPFQFLTSFFPQNNLRIMLMQDSLVAHQGWCAPFFKTPALVESYNKLGASPDKQPEKKKIQKTQSRKTTIQQKAQKKKTHGKSQHWFTGNTEDKMEEKEVAGLYRGGGRS